MNFECNITHELGRYLFDVYETKSDGSNRLRYSHVLNNHFLNNLKRIILTDDKSKFIAGDQYISFEDNNIVISYEDEQCNLYSWTICAKVDENFAKKLSEID